MSKQPTRATVSRNRAFDDNRLLAMIFGHHDKHLELIEQALDVTIVGRGNAVTIKGDGRAVERADTILGQLESRARDGLEVSSDDVKGAIRMTSNANNNEGKNSVKQIKTWRKVITPRSPGQQAYIDAIANHELVFGSGPAGTGKSYLAVACAVEALKAGRVERIIFSRPAVEAGENLGFLPGDLKEKVDPYLRPLYDALNDVMPPEKIERSIEQGVIEIAPLAFMRGRTLAHAFIILDEAQNTTPLQMKMFLTRLGEGSHMIINGDRSQVDLPRDVTSGLGQAIDLLENIEGIAHVAMGSRDIVRHHLVSRIVDAYDNAN